MNSDLIVMTFENEAGASKARGALEIMRNRYFLGVMDAVVVTIDSAGKAVVRPQFHADAQPRDPSSQVALLLADAIFVKPPEDGVKELFNAGLDERFVNAVSSALTPETSLILHYIQQDSLIDPQQVLDALKQFRGTLHHTTVPAEVEEAILKQAEYE